MGGFSCQFSHYVNYSADRKNTNISLSALDKRPVNSLDLYLAPSLNVLYIPIVARIQLMYQLN